MAIRIAGSGEYLSRTASLPDVALFSACGWAKLGTERDWYALFSIDDGSTKWIQIALNDASPTRALGYSTSTLGITGSFATRPANATWFFWAISHQAEAVPTGLNAYWSTGASAFVTASDDGMVDFAATGMFIGNDGFDDYGDAAFAHVKVWDAILTAAEFWQEMHSIRPQRVANLHLWTPLWGSGDIADYSGNGRNWTAGGTLTTEDGPPVSYGAPIWIVPFVEASGRTGALTATLGAATLSGAGTVAIAGALSKTLGTATLSAAGAVAITGTATPTLGAVTLSAAGAVTATAIEGALTATLGAATLSGAGAVAIAGALAKTLGAVTLSGAGTVAIAGTATPTLGAVTLSAKSYILKNACVGGVLTVSATNGRYFENDAGIILLSGFHTWYDVQDGGADDPPSAFDWSAYLAALVAKGVNWTKLWFMESAADWPDVSPQYYTPHPWARTGPGNAADGKLKFDLTAWDETYFTRLRERAIEAGNAGIYVTVQLFQGWHIDLKGFDVGDPWGYHPFEDGNNINSIDGDTDNDGAGEETRSTSFTAVYNLQKAYVEKVIDTLNDLDHVFYEIANEETHSTTTLAWQRALAAYVKSYESGKPKQHPVGITKLWPGGSNTDLFASDDADWISPDDDYPVPAPDPADGSKVGLYDTDHVVGLTDDHKWILQAFSQGNNLAYMDEWDGAIYGTDKREVAANELIRRLLGDALDYAARLDLAATTPQGALSTTGYCLAKTIGQYQFFVYQDDTGAFDLTLTSYAGTFSLEWFRVSTGATQAGTDVSGGAVRTLTPPWSGDVAAFLELIALEGALDATLGALTSSAAGTVALAGALAKTLDAATLSGAGTVAIAGAVAATLAALTSTAAGALAIVGTSTVTLAGATVAAVGVVAVAGALAKTLDAATASAAGALAIAGASSPTLDDVALSGAGVVAIAGTATPTLDAATLTSAGAIAITGALTKTLDAVTLTGAGVLTAMGTGALDATLGTMTLSGAATITLAGTASVTLDGMTVTAVGALAIAGALTQTLVDVALSGAGEFEGGLSGALTQTLAGATLTSAGVIAIAGALTQTLVGATLTGAGVVTLTGALTQTLADVALSGAGEFEGGLSGALTQTLDNATITAAGVVAIAGAATPTLGAVTLTGAGVVTLTGALTRTLADVVLGGAGELAAGPTGILTQTLANTTLTGAGVVAIAGAASVTLAGVTVTAVGALASVGTSSPTLEGATLTGTGALALRGQLSATLGNVTISAAGALDLITAVIVGAVIGVRATGTIDSVKTGGTI